jgi:hypothetical protein
VIQFSRAVAARWLSEWWGVKLHRALPPTARSPAIKISKVIVDKSDQEINLRAITEKLMLVSVWHEMTKD